MYSTDIVFPYVFIISSDFCLLFSGVFYIYRICKINIFRRNIK